MNINIAEFIFGIESDIAEEDLHTEKVYSTFLSSDCPEIFVRGHYEGLPDIQLTDSNLIFDSGIFWRVYSSKGNIIFSLYSSALGTNPYCIAVFKDDFRTGDVYHLSKNDEIENRIFLHPLAFPLFHLLMVSILSKGHGLLIHASGISDNGKGYLFPASSTHGKTTMARLWGDQATILNDERIILRARNNRLWIYGTPWHGELETISPSGVPLEGIFFIEHAKENDMRRVKGSYAAAELFKHCVQPQWVPEGMSFMLDFCVETVQTVPCFNLGFNPDKKVIDAIRAATIA